MKKFYFFFLLLISFGAKAQLLVPVPEFPKQSDAGIEITADATLGNQGLLNYDPNDVYIHTGVITNYSTTPADWKHIPFTNFNAPNAAAKATPLGGNKWKFTFGADLRTFYSVFDPNEKILKIAILFRSGNGSKKLANANGSDMYVTIFDATIAVKLTKPFKQPMFIPVPETITKNLGDNIIIEAKSNSTSNLKLFYNGTQIASTNGVSITNTPTITVPGNQRIIAEAELGGVFSKDTIDFFVASTTVIENLPTGVVDGINYEAGGTAATLVLFAPDKGRCTVIGDFSNWTEMSQYQMKKTPDGKRFWLRITGLTPGTEYAYQYLFDGVNKYADYNTEKILDPNNDQFISTATYPGLKPYPTGLTTGNVSILQTNKPAYTWSSGTFSKPDKRTLVVYELLVRDFVAKQDWKTLLDTLPYLKRLGINAIELMPINEFEGNNSWGYNPSFYFAPDKAYGPENDLKRFIDSCHRNGIAVIMDLAMNHSFGQSPMVQMYFDGASGRPTSNSPWFNPVAKHAFNVGYDFNHESQATKDFVDRVVNHWLINYRIDGFRWDLSKGFTQNQTCDNNGANCNVGSWSNYDASRVAIWNRIYGVMQAASNGSYCILEHFANNDEEKVLSNNGMLLWGNSNTNYSEAALGFIGNSNFQYGIFSERQWTNPTLVTYAESHDEERLNYKNINFGNASGSYDIHNLTTALKRQEMVAAFLIPIPGPKMILQFGELGYDVSISRCPDGSLNLNNCKTDPKPILWNYNTEPNRLALYNVYSKLNKLKTFSAYNATFITNNMYWELGGAFKQIKIMGPVLQLVIIGNFDVVPQSGNVTFPTGGTWFNYLSGGTFTATGGNQNITLQPSEYYVYTNINVQSALPLKLIGFEGKRLPNSIALNWTTSNEVNVKNFAVERSVDGIQFAEIGSVTATNNPGSQPIQYQYADAQSEAVNAKTILYYRLKMMDKDGKFTYSNVVAIQPVFTKGAISIYPNPVVGSTLNVLLGSGTSSNTNLTITDVSGRIFKTISTTSAGVVSINVQQLAAGMYLLKAQSNQNTTVLPFIVHQ